MDGIGDVVGWYAHDRDRSWRCAPPSGDALAFHRGLEGYEPTPLLHLPSLAAELGVGHVVAKDESWRLGLPAFKALGASYGVHRALSGRADDVPTTVVTATDGNHGRAVARFARVMGHRASIVVPPGVSRTAIEAIRSEGADVTEIVGSYDDAVSAAARLADEIGGVLVQDTAWDGYEEIPGWIVDGYATLFAETDAQLVAAGLGRPDLVVVPVGVGSLLQAALAFYRGSQPGVTVMSVEPGVAVLSVEPGVAVTSAEPGVAVLSAEPGVAVSSVEPGVAVMSVEPEAAACVAPSLAAGRPVTVETGETVMAGLNCGTPSSLAWPFVLSGLDAAVAVTDDADIRAAHDLADLGVAAGPCGAAGLAAARLALTGESAEDRRRHLGVGPDSVVLLVVTEGSAANPLPARPTSPS